jgi:hypothetical protein
MAFLSGTGAQTQEFSLTSLVIWPLASQRLYHPPSPTSSCSFSPPFSPLFHHISPVLFRRLSQAPFHHSHALVHHFSHALFVTVLLSFLILSYTVFHFPSPAVSTTILIEMPDCINLQQS